MNEEETDYVLDEIIKDTEEEVKMSFKPVKKDPPAPPKMITFDRYFLSLGLPVHHRAGMAAYGNTKGKKTLEAWKSLFASY